jgi:hypothetical protein
MVTKYHDSKIIFIVEHQIRTTTFILDTFFDTPVFESVYFLTKVPNFLSAISTFQMMSAVVLLKISISLKSTYLKIPQAKTIQNINTLF